MEAINAGEDSFAVEDAGSQVAAAKPPDGERWVDVHLVTRWRVKGEADADMVATVIEALLKADIDESGGEPVVIARGTQFESEAVLIEAVKISGQEQGLQ